MSITARKWTLSYSGFFVSLFSRNENGEVWISGPQEVENYLNELEVKITSLEKEIEKLKLEATGR